MQPQQIGASSSCWSIPLVLLALVLPGCGKSGQQLAPVSGRVLLDGQPLEFATVVFQPEAANGSTSYGTTDKDGRYELGYKRGVQGAQIGMHLVRITPATNDAGLGGKTAGGRPVVPPRYNTQSTLHREVKAGEDNLIDFELNSQAK